MSKPRVIIADADATYRNPLLRKFAEEFFEEIDLELITEKTYFDNLFSVPQKAEVLVVSEAFFDPALQRQHIGWTFLLTEKQEDQADAPKISRIFKYANLREIFGKILEKCAGLHSQGEKACQIILVDSACGGTGKTTVALGISVCLAKNLRRVLYINAGRLQTFQRVLQDQTPITDAAVYAKLADPSESIYEDVKPAIRKEQFDYLPPFHAPIKALGLPYSLYGEIALAAKKSDDYDFIVIDADTAFDDDHAGLLDIADKVLMITKQTDSAVFSTNVLVTNIDGLTGEKYLFVCNDFDKEKDDAFASPKEPLHFSVAESIEHMDHFDQLRCDDFSLSSGIQRTAFLFM